MSTLNLKARLSALEETLLTRQIMSEWWIFEIVTTSGVRGMNYAWCDGESYTREAGESEEDFISRVQSVPRPLMAWRSMSVSAWP